MQKPKTPVKKPVKKSDEQPTVLKNGKPVKLVKSSISEAFKNGGSVGSKKAMPKKAMGGKIGKKAC
jgi:hypothetical protein